MKFKRVLTVFVFLVTLGFGLNVYAQNPADYKVDELSDAKIRELMAKAEAIGYTDAQLEQMAAAQGMKPDEVAKLKKRVESIRMQDGSTGKVTNNSPVSTDGVKDVPGRKLNYDKPDSAALARITNEELMEKAFEDLKPKIFGAALFKNSKITFSPNLRMATPSSYIFGPDDEIVIDLSGLNDLQKPYSLKVSPEGVIRIPLIGSVIVGGLSVDQAKAKIRTAMLRTYPGIRTGETQLSITLGNIRSIQVTVNGQVMQSGTFTLPSLATVFTALYSCGGPNSNGSYRTIELIRNGKVINTIDVYELLLTGIQPKNIQLMDLDVINVPFYKTHVEMVGEVKNPAIYELLPGETFKTVLNFAGGFTTEAFKAKIKVFQNTDIERRIIDIQASDFPTYMPLNGDKFFVERILDRFENRVELSGAVFRPNTYGLESGLTVLKLINKAGGLKEDAFLSRAYIYRLASDNSITLKQFDLGRLLDKSDPDIALQREDRIVISSIFDLREEYKVSIAGAVRNPSTFSFAENMSLGDLIQMAGGFSEGATPNKIEISRRIRNSDSKSLSAQTAEVFTVDVDKDLKIKGTLFLLKPFDMITVRTSEGYEVQRQVYIEGEVLRPGPYTITRKNERISDLIDRAGGFTSLAYLDGAFLRRPGNGNRTEEDLKTLKNLKRLQESGSQNDTTSLEGLKEVFTSDLVGIDLTKIMAKRGSRGDLTLEEGDVIKVPKQPQTVKVTGEVLNPNNIVYQSGKSFRQYLNSAGGYTSKAFKRGVHIKYANGSVEAARKFLFFNNYPIVKPGAEIIVPPSAERKKVGTQEVIAISTAFASLAAIIITLFR